MKTETKAKIKGYFFSNLFGILTIGITKNYLLPSGTLVFSEFVIVPFLMGLISMWFWRNLNYNRFSLTVQCMNNTLIVVALSYIFLQEGFICLIIVAPLLLLFMLAGAITGKALYKKNNQNLNISVFGLMAIIFIADSLSAHHYENMVSDKMIVNAPVNEVWKHVVAFKKIEEKNKFWLFKVGMPSPVESTTDCYCLGANRKCIFSNGYVFDEKIVTYDENRNLTFDVTHQPRDPEIMGHIDILRGQFLLTDNGDNTTTLIGNSWYRLYVFPIWYYDLWAESITRNVHLRVMEHIKDLSEHK